MRTFASKPRRSPNPYRRSPGPRADCRLVAVAGSTPQGFRELHRAVRIGELIDGDWSSGRKQNDQPGDLVTGRLGWQEYAIAKPEDLLPRRGLRRDLVATALSSPGLTAYCAMEMFGRPMPGQTSCDVRRRLCRQLCGPARQTCGHESRRHRRRTGKCRSSRDNWARTPASTIA